MVNLVTNRVVKIVGKVENTERFLRLALYQVRGALQAPLRAAAARASAHSSSNCGCPVLCGLCSEWHLPPPCWLQGIPRKAKRLPAGPDAKLPQPDPTLLCCAFQRQRLYLFTQVGLLKG